MVDKSSFSISLKNNLGYGWTCVGNSWVKGFAFVGNVLYEGSLLLKYCIDSILSPERDRLLRLLNGSFLVVAVIDGDVYLISDKMRGFPLFYCYDNGIFHVFDSEEELVDNISYPRLCIDNIPYFLSCGYLYGGETLIENCFLVPPASLVSFSKGKLSVVRYDSRRFTKKLADNNYNDNCYSIVSRMAERLKAFARGRQIVIPLSGGYDSRLLACMCRIFGLDNVVCYTYGADDSNEVRVAGKVCESLNLKLYKIGISKEKWDNIFSTDIVKKYLAYGGNLNAVAHLQDFFAIYELNKNNLVESNAIFVPGHSGDLLGGSHFLSETNSSNLVKKTFDKYFIVNVLNRKDERKVKAELGSQLLGYSDLKTVEDCYESVYQWNIDCRQPNYIINSVRAYEFFGYSWFLPLWDDEFTQFWSSIYCVQRKGENLYADFLFEKFFIPLSVDFRKREIHNSRIKGLLDRYLSYGDKYRIKRLLSCMHLYKFPDDNSLLNKALVHIVGYGQYDKVSLLPCREDSMSAKSLYYLYYLSHKYSL